jgi:hypothetical protein
VLSATAKDRLLDLSDSLGNFNSSRAGFGAVEGGAATPDTFFIIQDIQSNFSSFIS